MKVSLILLLSLCYVSLTAQKATNEILKQQLVRDWERAKAYSQEYLDAMPAEKYSFRPVDSVRTFAEQMLHFAQANVGMAFIGTGIQNRVQGPLFGPNFGKSISAQSKDSVAYYVNASYDVMINAVRNFDFGRLNEMTSRDLPGGRRSATRLGWLMKAFEHQTHHRGQCTIYLRLAGVRPPAEKLWD